jgi:tryptophan synthase alpha chain
MNRIDQLFLDKKENILSIYFTAGYPSLNDTIPVLTSIEKAGADMVEIGIPFSDPLADGPIIQNSSHIALQNGMTLKLLLNQLKDVRTHLNIPILLMGYLNPVLQFGMEQLLKRCKEIGIDGLIIPDLPLDEYEENYQQLFESYDINLIFLLTPQTSEERCRKIDAASKGFTYMVSSASITGIKGDISRSQIDYFERINALELKKPRLIGFGISNRQTFQIACEHAQGAIIGSAFVKALEGPKSLNENVEEFIRAIKSF